MRRIPRWVWWTAAGAGLVALANQGKAQASVTAERLGDMVVRIALKPGTLSLPAMNAIMNALGTARDVACPTFPRAINVSGGMPAVIGNGFQATLSATWTHNRLGAIKSDVRACILKYLQGLNPNVVDFSAERVS